MDAIRAHEFDDTVRLEWLDNRMLVVLQAPMKLANIVIPEGFITDGATIPKLFWNILSPFGRYFKSCVLHDYICLLAKLQGNDGSRPLKESIHMAKQYRKRADTLLSLSMKKQGISLIKRMLIMSSVRSYSFTRYSVGAFIQRAYKKSKPFKIEPYYLYMIQNNAGFKDLNALFKVVSLEVLDKDIDLLRKG